MSRNLRQEAGVAGSGHTFGKNHQQKGPMALSFYVGGIMTGLTHPTSLAPETGIRRQSLTEKTIHLILRIGLPV